MEKEQIYKRALEVMEENFGHITEMSVASCADKVVSVRDVNAYYRNGRFYILGKCNNTLFRDITVCPNVGICHGSHNMHGVARSLGHPLEAQNAELRKTLRFRWKRKTPNFARRCARNFLSTTTNTLRKTTPTCA